MTIRELAQVGDQHPYILLAAAVVPVLLAWMSGAIHGKGNGAVGAWKYLYSVLVYAVCIPGMFSSVLTAYMLFFRRDNLMDVNPLVYFMPIVTMIVTLILIRKNVSLDDVPGFDRLSGLMVMMACSFGVALAVDKTHIWVWVGASFTHMLGLAVVVFALMRWGAYTLFRGRDEPKQDRPGLKPPEDDKF